jgi:hypothetical protein
MIRAGQTKLTWATTSIITHFLLRLGLLLHSTSLPVSWQQGPGSVLPSSALETVRFNSQNSYKLPVRPIQAAALASPRPALACRSQYLRPAWATLLPANPAAMSIGVHWARISSGRDLADCFNLLKNWQYFSC